MSLNPFNINAPVDALLDEYTYPTPNHTKVLVKNYTVLAAKSAGRFVIVFVGAVIFATACVLIADKINPDLQLTEKI